MAVAAASRLRPAGEQEKAGGDILSTSCVVPVVSTASASLSCAMNGWGNDYRVAIMMQHHDCSHGATKAMCNHCPFWRDLPAAGGGGGGAKNRDAAADDVPVWFGV